MTAHEFTAPGRVGWRKIAISGPCLPILRVYKMLCFAARYVGLFQNYAVKKFGRLSLPYHSLALLGELGRIALPIEIEWDTYGTPGHRQQPTGQTMQ